MQREQLQLLPTNELWSLREDVDAKLVTVLLDRKSELDLRLQRLQPPPNPKLGHLSGSVIPSKTAEPMDSLLLGEDYAALATSTADAGIGQERRRRRSYRAVENNEK